MTRKIAVWMDGNEARVFHVREEGFDEATVWAPAQHVHRHPKDQQMRIRNHPDDQHRFFDELADALAGAERILVVGPAATKLLFLRYLHKRDPALEARIVGLETVDHPTDRQIVAYARQYFHPAEGTD